MITKNIQKYKGNRRKRSKRIKRRVRSTLGEAVITLEPLKIKNINPNFSSEEEESIEKQQELSKESSVKNLDPLCNTSVPVHLKSKVNYFFTPYNNKFEFSNDPLQINEGQNWKVLTDFICENDKTKFIDRCELIKHNLEMEGSEKEIKSVKLSLRPAGRPKAKKSFNNQAVKIFDEEETSLDRNLSFRDPADFLCATPHHTVKQIHSPVIKEEESDSDDSVSGSGSLVRIQTHKINIRRPKEKESIIMKEINHGMKALLKKEGLHKPSLLHSKVSINSIHGSILEDFRSGLDKSSFKDDGSPKGSKNLSQNKSKSKFFAGPPNDKPKPLNSFEDFMFDIKPTISSKEDSVTPRSKKSKRSVQRSKLMPSKITNLDMVLKQRKIRETLKEYKKRIKNLKIAKVDISKAHQNIHNENFDTQNKIKERSLRKIIMKRSQEGRRNLKNIGTNKPREILNSTLPELGYKTLFSNNFSKKMRIRNVKTRQGHRLKRSLEVIDRASLEEKKKIQNFLNTSAKFNKLSKKASCLYKYSRRKMKCRRVKYSTPVKESCSNSLEKCTEERSTTWADSACTRMQPEERILRCICT
ncbi:unnamed protein product [Moneuplotes crassus]|uniref:Uncharacterized protein n=1 Tax=Euplotes crassus TaxID=5936 RepID=A0AAD1Y4H7_EUPCR|nr:unnamed protein product [Moneuplotes crassus]